jgi:hypothetical protein
MRARLACEHARFTQWRWFGHENGLGSSIALREKRNSRILSPPEQREDARP